MKLVKPLLLLFLSSLLLSACSTAPEAAATGDSKGRADHSPTPTQVQIASAEEKPVDQLVVVTGTLAADQEVVLGFKVSGRLAEIPVDLGSSVQKGQSIARLDTTDFELRVRQAEAALQARVRLGLSPESDLKVCCWICGIPSEGLTPCSHPFTASKAGDYRVSVRCAKPSERRIFLKI